MRTKMYWAGGALLAAVLGLTAAGVHAQGPPPGGDFGRQGRGFRGPAGEALRELAIRHLDLSDAQQEQVRGILESHRSEFDANREGLRTAQRNLNVAVTGSAFDEALVRARSTELGALQADAAVLRAKVYGEVWSILTSEQQQKAAELKAKVAERMQQRQQQRQQRQPRQQ